MNTLKRLSQVFKSAEQIPFDDSSKIVIFSDCHRGNGSWIDDFSKNQNLFFAALTHYYKENFTYIELGDGDELWGDFKISDIMNIHSHAYWLMSKFYKEGRLHMIYGNHDMDKKNPKFVRNNLFTYYDDREKRNTLLFENIKIHEGIILKHKASKGKIYMTHGHQADILNDNFWRLSRFLVRFVWRPLKVLGVNDPTSAAKNNKKKVAIEKKLVEWVVKTDEILVTGHTHRPMFPDFNEPPYFNDGSCVHPRCITAIEIADGKISLIKWDIKTKSDGTLYVGREVLAGPRRLTEYFSRRYYYRNETAHTEEVKK